MSHNKNNLSFGRYLRTNRLEKGINLEVVVRETKIRMDTLLLIEQEDHKRLPAEVFVKGFLRAYAKIIGVDEDKVIRNYLSSLKKFKETAKSEDELIRMNINYWPRLLLSIGTLLCIISLSVYITSIFQDQALSPTTKDQKPARQKEPVENKSDSLTETPEVSYPIKNYPENISEKLLLKITALEITWMKVIVDDKNPKEHILHPGDHLELEASSNFHLLIGNAGGVKVTLNDKPIEALGKSGQVVNVQLP